MDDPVGHCLAGNSLLLTGLPGTGKTHLARTIVLPGIEASRPRHLPGIEASTPAAPPARHRSIRCRAAFSILWPTQDCSTQSCRQRRIAPLNPALAAGLPPVNPVPNTGLWCLPENSVSALLYSRALTRRPASRLRIWQLKQRDGEDQAVSCA